MKYVTLPPPVPVYLTDGRTPLLFQNDAGETEPLVLTTERFMDIFVAQDRRFATDYASLRRLMDLLSLFRGKPGGAVIELPDALYTELKAALETPSGGYANVLIARQAMPFFDAVVNAPSTPPYAQPAMDARAS